MSGREVVCLHHHDFMNFPRANKQISSLAAQDGVSVTGIAPWFDNTEPDYPAIDGAEFVHKSPPLTLPNVHVLKILNVLLAMVVLGNTVRRTRADIYHCIGPYALFIAVVVSAFRHDFKITYDAPEEYGCQIEAVYSGYFGAALAWTLRKAEWTLVRFAVVAFTVNSSTGLPYDRLNSANGQTYILENVPRLSEFELDTDRENPIDVDGAGSILDYVGGVSRRKGGDMLLDVMEHVVDRYPDTRLMIIGHGSERYMDHLYSRVDRLGLGENIDILGPIDYDDVRSYLANADIGVQFYQHGPWKSQSKASSTIFRHMGFELPVVVTDLPGMGSQIREYECGLAPSVTDERELADAVCELLTDRPRAEELGSRGRRLVETTFNWEKESKLFLEQMPISVDG
jgi:glycosyltransferase involved in cell wall biosynthesis